MSFKKGDVVRCIAAWDGIPAKNNNPPIGTVGIVVEATRTTVKVNWVARGNFFPIYFNNEVEKVDVQEG